MAKKAKATKPRPVTAARQIREVWQRLSGELFVDRCDSPKDELVAYRDSARQLLSELKAVPE